MFNQSLKKKAIALYIKAEEDYSSVYEQMMINCNNLYGIRVHSLIIIHKTEHLINSIANTPKEMDAELGEIKKNKKQFDDTVKFAEESNRAIASSGTSAATGVIAGSALAKFGPKVLMGIATTFGKATTGRAISTLSGAAAKKAAINWLGRATGGLLGGKALLALMGPLGWGITAASTGASLISLTKKNSEIARSAIESIKEIQKAVEANQETSAKIQDLYEKTSSIKEGLQEEQTHCQQYMNADYQTLNEYDKKRLGTLVNNTCSLATLLTKTIE